MLYKQLIEIIGTLEEAAEYLDGVEQEKCLEENAFLIDDMASGIQNVNRELFFCDKTEGFDIAVLLDEIKQTGDIDSFCKKVTKWCEFVKGIIEKRQQQPNELDERFISIMDYVQYVEQDDMIEHIKMRLQNMDELKLLSLNYFFQTHSHFWGTLDTKNGKYDVIYDRVKNLKKNRETFIWLYYKLGDYRSKLVLVNTLYNWISFNPAYIQEMHEGNFKDYYDLDLLSCDENEVLVDIGAYTGDSALDYITTYRKYKKIYCYEITPESIEQMKHSLKGYENIEIVNKGVGSEARKMFLQTCALDASTNELNEVGSGIEIEVVTLDEDVKEKVTLIKMDIEGAEKDALKGCIRHIKEERPKLMICVYHNNSDIFEIPKMIMDMRDDYKLYLRSNGLQWAPAELVLFAL